MIGTQLGHYRIEEKLGEGGMGVVYKAHDTHLDRAVAIKVLSAEAVSDPERKRRFVQEARTASSLNHPNILHIYDIDQSDGVDFMAMEFVQGKTLDRLSGHAGLPLADLLNYAVQIAGALARAHGAGIVHRDIKPANIMVTAEGLVKVLDFGLAKLTEPLHEARDSDLTQTVPVHTEPGVIFGTAQYMSPEQAEGKSVDARSDIFSLGTVLYEMIAGRRPFQGDSKLAILAAVLGKDPAPIGEIRNDVPPELDQIVSRCLRKNPDDRFQHMGDLKAALEQVQETIRTPSVRTLAGSAAPSLGRRVRRKWLWIGAAAAVVLLVAIVLIWRGSHTNRTKLIAVLPFQSAASDPASQAFSAGLTDILGRKLVWLNQFQTDKRILPPGDIHGDAALGPAEARKKLAVDLVLTGTLQWTGANVRWTATLIGTNPVHDVKRREMQTSLGDLDKQIAKILDLHLTRRAEQILTLGDTTIPEAADTCLQAYGYLQHADRPGDLDHAVSLFQVALAQDNSYGLAYAGLGEALWAKSSLSQDKPLAEQARENCLRAIARNADLPEVHLTLGKIYSGTGRPQDAVTEFRRTLQLDPLSIAAHTGLAAAYEALGQLSDSEGVYRALVDLWPTYLLPYSHLGAFYFRQGRYKDAEPVFRKVVELAPENATGYQNLGALYHALGRADDAAAMMKKSLSIRPSANGYANLGTLYFFQGHYSDAVPLMEKAVEMDGSNYVYWGNLADAYRWAPEYKDRAPEAYQQAIKLAEHQPHNDASLRGSLAAYYAKLPDRAKALTEIAQARRLAPMNPTVLFDSALVYEIAGKRDQALSALNLALQGGYSIDEVRGEPELATLRKDPRYARLDKGISPDAAAKSAH